jgi:hypothetical protein
MQSDLARYFRFKERDELRTSMQLVRFKYEYETTIFSVHVTMHDRLRQRLRLPAEWIDGL